MKRIFLNRRRRYLYRAAVLGFVAAALIPSAALAGYDERGAGVAVDPFVASSISAEDDHGMSASTGVVLPSADRKAVEQAQGSGFVYRRADDFAPPRNLTPPAAAAGPSTDWSQIALWASLGLAGIVGALALMLSATRRRTHLAHS